eukprot:jgi/Ulvmu1/9278/UM050_0027.1
MPVGGKCQHGQMHVYKADLLNDLPAGSATLSLQEPKSSSNRGVVADSAEDELLRNAPYAEFAMMSPQERAAWQHAQALRLMRSEAEKEHAQAVEAAKQAKLRRELAEDEMMQDVFAGMTRSTGITLACSETIAVQQKVKLKKRTRLYKDWKACVHEKIQKRIGDAMLKTSIEQLEAKLRRAFQDYLSTSNTKDAAIFRDVIIEADYNPMKYAEQNIRVKTGDIQDPVKLDILKPLREAALMGTRPEEVPMGKAVLSPLLWDRLGSTPYGRNMDPDGSYVVKPVDEHLAELQKSHIPMDHYNFPRDRKALDREMPKGKSTRPQETKGRVNFVEIIQRMDEMATESVLKAQGKADGDAWLGYRGRKVPPGPEMRRGRKSLFDVLRHSCAEDLVKNPHFTGGDAWLEKKGKARVPGPEQRRGRQNLFETFQQSSNPYMDGRTLDDIFLEAKGKSSVPHPSQSDINRLYQVLQDRDIQVAVPSGLVKPHQISELVPVNGSLTTRSVPKLTGRS